MWTENQRKKMTNMNAWTEVVVVNICEKYNNNCSTEMQMKITEKKEMRSTVNCIFLFGWYVEWLMLT